MENQYSQQDNGSFEVKVGLAEMLKGGVIIDVTCPDDARIAEEAGALAVVARGRTPSDANSQSRIARMTDPELIQKIQEVVSIPVMAQCRIGHFVEAQILEALFVDFIIESDVLTPADEEFHILKKNFKIPFICSCSNLGEALCRIGEGAAMIMLRGGANTGNVAEIVRNLRGIRREIRRLRILDQAELMVETKRLGAPYHLVEHVAKTGKLPVPLCASGGIVTPADAALMMQLGAESVFVGSGIFSTEEPVGQAVAIVSSITYCREPEVMAKISMGLLGPEEASDEGYSEKEEQASASWC
jgi:pyridoxal 5'-phosphate synthase pdxS subunit